MFQVLGIDVGSVAVSVALLNQDQEIIKTDYRLHRGAIRDTLIDIFKNIDLDQLGGIATTTSTPDILHKSTQYNNQLAIITVVRKYHPDTRTILIVGGENFGRITFKESGEYESYHTNSSCAVGTGSFLDQQVSRLNLDSIEKMAELAFSNKDITPPIASRCAVFAKTDIIHAQQEGYSLAQICDSLCEGLVKNITDTLFGDEPIKKPLVFTGGVSRNKAVIKHLTVLLGTEPVVGKYSYLYGAIGAALIHLKENKLSHLDIHKVESLLIQQKKKLKYGYEPLELKLSDYPEFKSLEKFNYLSENNVAVEVDIYQPLTSIVYMGVDIGSTSTKAVLIDEDHKVLAGFYTMTAGQPLKATQLIFEVIDNIHKADVITFR
jgi:activator of 2-hydroxyglutaryl-CoA dehydratase